jgi:uncharacterized SAM-binding protein YcdF (DUF218 family)
MLIIYDTIKTLVLPPADVLVALVVGIVLIARGRRRLGLGVIVAATAVLYILSTPFVGSALMRAVQTAPASDETLSKSGAQAIVILSAGFIRYAPEYGTPVVDQLTLQRLRYGAHLARRLDLPVLVTGGTPERAPFPLAEMMKSALEQDFGVKVRWTEDRSRDTYENAAYSAAILKADGIRNIILVTHAAHMRRAAALFAAQGLAVTEAPTVFATPLTATRPDLMPRLSGLQDSYYALYESLGAIWYAIRY